MRLVPAVLLWMAVLGLSAAPISSQRLMHIIRGSMWLSVGTVVQATMLLLSLGLILALSKGRLARYGFRMATGAEFKQAFAVGTGAGLAVQVLIALLWKMLPPSGTDPPIGGSSFVQTVLTVWLIASICEETLHRGLIQSFLEPLRAHGIAVCGIRLSLPVTVAALLFGAMHIMLLTTAAGGVRVGGIVGAATVLGLVAGYYREKTGSILPAILIHMVFNACGSASDYIRELVVR